MTSLLLSLALFASAAPAKKLPADAIEAQGAAEYAFKTAKSEADYVAAADQYAEASKAAPWHAPYYFNEGVAREKAGQLDRARDCFEKYLKAAPKAKDEEEVRKRIGGLKFAAKKKADESLPQALERKRKEQEAAAVKELQGARFSRADVLGNGDKWTWILAVSGAEIVLQTVTDWGPRMRELNPGSDARETRERVRAPLRGRYFTLTGELGDVTCEANCPLECALRTSDNGVQYWKCPQWGEISADGQTARVEFPGVHGEPKADVYRRE